MASTIITKNGTSGAPSSLTAGELAINTTDGGIYYGSTGGTSVSSSFKFGMVTASVVSASGNVEGGSLRADDLTAGRVAFVGTDGLLVDDSDLTFATATLTATNIAAFNLTGKLTAGSNEIEGSNFDITGGSIVAISSLDISEGDFTTSGAQKLAIVQGVGEDIDIGDYELRAQTLESDVAIGTAPLTITSTTVVANLNADKLDGADLVDEDDMASNSATKVRTQQSVKAYVDGKVKQIINIKGYATLQNNIYDFANSYSSDDEAPFQLDENYGSGTIGSGTTVNQSKFFRAGGFHVPFACTISNIQAQITCNNDGDVSIAVVEYRPNADANTDYPRTVYETVVVDSEDNNNRVSSTTITTANLDASDVAAGSHIMIMVKGDGTSAGGTLVVSAGIGLSW